MLIMYTAVTSWPRAQVHVPFFGTHDEMKTRFIVRTPFKGNHVINRLFTCSMKLYRWVKR